jgi:hypothetical protein
MVNPKNFTIEGVSWANLRYDDYQIAAPRKTSARIFFKKTHVRFETKAVENYVYVRNVVALDATV